jgi:predicted anti-sigma-YlaC factor YlaD
MDCQHTREAISARLDGEDAGPDAARLDQHVAGCATCAAWAADLDVLHRLVRVRAAEPVPDLTAAILGAAPRSQPALADRVGERPSWWRPFTERISTVRWALFAIALTQLVLAGPALLLGEDAGATVHVARELGSFDVALAVGLLVAAWQPARAWGLLPVAGALALVLGLTAVLDVVDGTASGFGEAHHVLDLAGVALLWLVAREGRSAGAVRRPRATGWTTA